MTASPAPDYAPGERPRPLALTPRETEILRLLTDGFSNKEIARRLEISVRTVETHRINLRRKTKTGRLKDLVALRRSLEPVRLDVTPTELGDALSDAFDRVYDGELNVGVWRGIALLLAEDLKLTLAEETA